jgi:hypothetical protein
MIGTFVNCQFYIIDQKDDTEILKIESVEFVD